MCQGRKRTTSLGTTHLQFFPRSCDTYALDFIAPLPFWVSPGYKKKGNLLLGVHGAKKAIFEKETCSSICPASSTRGRGVIFESAGRINISSFSFCSKVDYGRLPIHPLTKTDYRLTAQSTVSWPWLSFVCVLCALSPCTLLLVYVKFLPCTRWFCCSSTRAHQLVYIPCTAIICKNGFSPNVTINRSIYFRTE